VSLPHVMLRTPRITLATPKVTSVAWRTPFDSRPIKCWSGPSRISSPDRGAGPVEHHLGELFPRVGFIVTTLTGTNRAVVHFYNGRGTAEQWIKEGKAATHWTRLSCHRFRANEVRLLLGVIAYNLGNLLRRLALPLAIQNWSLTSLQQRLFKTGGRLIRHARYFTLQLAESYLTWPLFRRIVARIAQLAWYPT
jgi:hypothetical protein